jgi:glycosyltransferase involved in cell wall biosynthesis
MMMRILQVHNYYTQPGGEDTVFESDVDLLRTHGHEVATFIVNNEEIASMQKAAVIAETMWSRRSYRKISALIRDFKPQVVQFYNTFPLISPAAYYACRSYNIPVIQYLFNPRLMCPAATFYRDGQLCTDCLGKSFPWPGVLHACYHDSRWHTLAVATMLAVHRAIKTWSETVDMYLSATDFYRNLYIQGGLPAKKVAVKPNYVVSDPGLSTASTPKSYVLFVGRLDAEKGIHTLLKAWRSLKIPLRIRGNGQLEAFARNYVAQHKMDHIEFVERLTRTELAELRKNARFLIWPSEGYYETFGLAAVESFAQGVPVIASDIGIMTEIVRDGETGLLFTSGDPIDLARKAEWLWNHLDAVIRFGKAARREYEEKYTAERSYQMIMEIYRKLIQEKMWKSQQQID